MLLLRSQNPEFIPELGTPPEFRIPAVATFLFKFLQFEPGSPCLHRSVYRMPLIIQCFICFRLPSDILTIYMFPARALKRPSVPFFRPDAIILPLISTIENLPETTLVPLCRIPFLSIHTGLPECKFAIVVCNTSPPGRKIKNNKNEKIAARRKKTIGKEKKEEKKILKKEKKLFV